MRSSWANYAHPELAGLLPVLYPGGLPAPRRLYARTRRPRGDPAHRHPVGDHRGSRNNTGSTPAGPVASQHWADSPAIVAEPETASSAGTSPDSRTAAGCSTMWPPSRSAPSPAPTIPLVDPSFTPDGARGAVRRLLGRSVQRRSVPGNGRYIDHFPYLGTPLNGFDTTELNTIESARSRSQRAGGPRHRWGTGGAAGDRGRQRSSAPEIEVTRRAARRPNPTPACTSADVR